MYATETFTWSRKIIEKFENSAMRWMSNKRLSSRTTIKRLYEITGLQKVVILMKQKKLRWYGNFKRSNLPVRVAVEGMVEGKRRQGRPRRRWRMDIVEWCESNWSDINKKLFKTVTHGVRSVRNRLM